MSDFGRRFEGHELMDDLGLKGASLDRALDELVLVNRYLGGYAATLKILGPYLLRRRPERIRVLDLGTGLADVPAVLVRWAAERAVDLHVTAVEGNERVVELARRWLDSNLDPELRARIEVVEADVWALPEAWEAYDVVTASLFLHHMAGCVVVDLLRLMKASARDGIIVNDLHRHALAHQGIRTMGSLLRASPVFRHDAPISVMRGFDRTELEVAAAKAGLDNARVRWHWAFRWTLSTVE